MLIKEVFDLSEMIFLRATLLGNLVYLPERHFIVICAIYVIQRGMSGHDFGTELVSD